MREGFDPNVSSTWTDEEKAVYEVGYAEGRRSAIEDRRQDDIEMRERDDG